MHEMKVNKQPVAGAIAMFVTKLYYSREFRPVLGLRWHGMSDADALFEFEVIRSRAGINSNHAE
jgi:hypothetical protein